MRPTRKNTGLWAYLERLGKLDASHDELVILKKEYRKEYLRSYKKLSRAKNKEFTVIFHRGEIGEIRRAAKESGLSEPAYIKSAAQAYIATIYLVRDKAVLDRIFQFMLRLQSVIEQLQDRDVSKWYKPDKNYRLLSDALDHMREEMSEAFMKPLSLTDAVSTALKNNPDFKNILIDLVKHHDSQKPFPQE
jgi:hypothetical protein